MATVLKNQLPESTAKQQPVPAPLNRNMWIVIIVLAIILVAGTLFFLSKEKCGLTGTDVVVCSPIWQWIFFPSSSQKDIRWAELFNVPQGYESVAPPIDDSGIPDEIDIESVSEELSLENVTFSIIRDNDKIDYLLSPFVIAGDLAYIKSNQNGSQLIVYKGREIKYNSFSTRDIFSDGKSLFFLEGRNLIYNENRKLIGELVDGTYPLIVDGRFTFAGFKADPYIKHFIYFGGKEISDDRYRRYVHILNVEDKLSFVAKGSDGKTHVVIDGESTESYNSSVYDIEKAIAVGNEVALLMYSKEADEYYIFLGGKDVTSGSGNVIDDNTEMWSVGGKLLYETFNDEDCSYGCLVYENRKLKYEYTGDYNLDSPYDLGGKLGFEAVDPLNKDRHIIYFDGEEYGREYDDVTSPFFAGGKLGYIALDGEDSFVVNGDSEFHKYSPFLIDKEKRIFAGYPFDVGGKLAFFFKYKDSENKNRSLIYYDGLEIGKEYDIWNPVGVGGKLAFLAVTEDNEIVIFVEK